MIKPPTPPPPSSGGPVFAGLKSATLCIAGAAGAPQVVPPARSYSLSWNPATDPVTPSDKIVYDIYYSSTSGGENFSSPLATTGPGATAYSGSVPGSGAAYFRRARARHRRPRGPQHRGAAGRQQLLSGLARGLTLSPAH